MTLLAAAHTHTCKDTPTLAEHATHAHEVTHTGAGPYSPTPTQSHALNVISLFTVLTKCYWHE